MLVCLCGHEKLRQRPNLKKKVIYVFTFLTVDRISIESGRGIINYELSLETRFVRSIVYFNNVLCMNVCAIFFCALLTCKILLSL